MPVTYNSKYIIPAPFVNIEAAKRRTGDARQIGSGYTIQLTGSFLSNISGIFSSEAGDVDGAYIPDDALSLLLDKQQELIQLFSEEGLELVVQGLDTVYSTMKIYPRIDSISFGEGNWVRRCEYTVSLFSDNAYNEDGEIIDQEKFGTFGDYRLDTVGDNYDMTNNENGSAEILRTITSKGSLVYSSLGNGQILDGQLPWQQASGWCSSVYSDDLEPWYSGIVEGILPAFEVIDTKVEVDVDQLEGTYSITRGWIISNVGVYILTKSVKENEDISKTN